MIFTTAQFVLFFALVWPVYAWSRGTVRKVVVLAASYAFYGSWDWRFLFLLVGSTALDFVVARRIATSPSEGQRRFLLAISVIGNLGVLATFKYLGFFIESAVTFLQNLGLSAQGPVLEWVLPVGISFYTFQTLGYTVDVFRGRVRATRSWLDFANYVAFFPQLVAGPIERAAHLLPQLQRLGDRCRTVDGSGWGMVALGAFKKVVIADNLALVVEATYHQPADVHTPALLLGTYAFAVQIYCDFSGYSDIAVGLARLMGIDLMQNFRAPYAATGPRDFWGRWHISLSTWLRDYLYIPLGGNRRGQLRTAVNLVITMLLGGLWHGAAWTFVAWGAFHGGLLILGRIPSLVRAAEAVPSVLRRLAFFHLVCLGWVLFRAESTADARVILIKFFDLGGWRWSRWFYEVGLSGQGPWLLLMAALSAVVVGAQMVNRRGSDEWIRTLWQTRPWIRGSVVVVLLAACVVFAPEERPPFVYFQF